MTLSRDTSQSTVATNQALDNLFDDDEPKKIIWDFLRQAIQNRIKLGTLNDTDVEKFIKNYYEKFLLAELTAKKLPFKPTIHKHDIKSELKKIVAIICAQMRALSLKDVSWIYLETLWSAIGSDSLHSYSKILKQYAKDVKPLLQASKIHKLKCDAVISNLDSFSFSIYIYNPFNNIISLLIQLGLALYAQKVFEENYAPIENNRESAGANYEGTVDYMLPLAIYSISLLINWYRKREKWGKFSSPVQESRVTKLEYIIIHKMMTAPGQLLFVVFDYLAFAWLYPQSENNEEISKFDYIPAITFLILMIIDAALILRLAYDDWKKIPDSHESDMKRMGNLLVYNTTKKLNRNRPPVSEVKQESNFRTKFYNFFSASYNTVTEEPSVEVLSDEEKKESSVRKPVKRKHQSTETSGTELAIIDKPIVNRKPVPEPIADTLGNIYYPIEHHFFRCNKNELIDKFDKDIADKICSIVSNARKIRSDNSYKQGVKYVGEEREYGDSEIKIKIKGYYGKLRVGVKIRNTTESEQQLLGGTNFDILSPRNMVPK